MPYQRGDYRYGNEYRTGDRWRDRERGARYGGGRYRDDDDRGFFDRAGDEVRSWFGDEEAERRRDRDQRRWEREQGYGDRYGLRRSSEYGGGYYGSDYDRAGDDYPRGDFGQDTAYPGRSGSFRPADTWGGSGFGGYETGGRRFDRIDSGSTGTHGVHPMASAAGGAYGAGYGVGSYGDYGPSHGYEGTRRAAGRHAGDIHDRNYSEWRQRQMQQLDSDYDEYRREHQQQFDSEFAGWREKRQGQRQSLRQVTEHREVIGSDGEHIGTVDKVRGDRIILTTGDSAAGGHHHSIPCSWIERVDEKVMVNKSSTEAMAAWRDEDRNRALFEREDQGSEGPHMLNRSFSGTY
jgi:hypothetical protein